MLYAFSIAYEFHFGTLVLGLWRQKLKYRLISDHLFQTTQEHGSWKEPQGKTKFLQQNIVFQLSDVRKIIYQINLYQ